MANPIFEEVWKDMEKKKDFKIEIFGQQGSGMSYSALHLPRAINKKLGEKE